MPNIHYYIDSLEQKIKIAYSANDWGEVIRLREIVDSLKKELTVKTG